MKRLGLIIATVLIASVMFVGCKGDDSSSSMIDSSGSSSSSTTDSSGTNSDTNSDTAFNMKDTITSVYNNAMFGEDDWLDDVDQTMLGEVHGMKFDNIEEIHGKVPGKNTQATAIIGAKAKPGKVSEAKVELTKYLDSMKTSFKEYLPDQYEITNNAQFVEDGDYVYLVMSENVDDVVKELKTHFKK